jgi:hypothetical protein
MRPFALAAALTLAAFARPARACAPAPPPGVTVQIAEESAIIAWDAEAHREDFIRRASFRTTGKDFGFLVPTPGKPDLSEVPDEVFDRLESATGPAVMHQVRMGGVEPTLFLASLFLSRKAVPASVTAPVRVLEARRVAGYDAVVLEADSPGALAGWLKAHGYAERAELSAWLSPYVAAKWTITAFKIAPAGEGAAVGTSAVRMSFSADRPFFPYREPSDQRETVQASHAERLLRVFFFGTERAEGTIGGAGTESAKWLGRTVWSDRFDAVGTGPLPFAIPGGAWLTMFEDRASPRPGTDDLFFAPAADTSAVKPPPVVLVIPQKMPLPFDLIGGSMLLGALVLRRLRKHFLQR